MITNPGFTFYSLSATHTIVPIEDTDLHKWGPQDKEAVICKTNNKLIKVYDNGPGFEYKDESIALTFASLDYKNKDQIIEFCDKYGIPYSKAPFGNFRNDYIFFDINKEEYMANSPWLNKDDRTSLFEIQRNIIQMKKFIELSQSIQNQDIESIINIVTYFCFDLYGLDFEGSKYNTETFQFNHSFFRYAECAGYEKKNRVLPLSLSELIIDFLADIEFDNMINISAASSGIFIPQKYVQINFALWKGFHIVFSKLLEITTIEKIDTYGNITFNPSINIELLIFSDEIFDIWIKIAKSVLSDILTEQLHRVYPEIVFNDNGVPESSWRIPSLLDAMYLELFFRLSPNSQAKKCGNPNCTKYYIWSSSKPSKKYCSESCARLMAKRMQRERERKNKNSKT